MSYTCEMHIELLLSNSDLPYPVLSAMGSVAVAGPYLVLLTEALD
jgi:hypothetical protein